jgi:hypothetical protein
MSLNPVSGFKASYVPQIFGHPSELNLPIAQILHNRVFNPNYFLQFYVCPTLISSRDKWEAKCCQSENTKVSSFLVQFQTDFPSTDQEISLKSPVFPLVKLFQNNLHAMAALRNWPSACMHSCQNRPWSYVFQTSRHTNLHKADQHSLQLQNICIDMSPCKH